MRTECPSADKMLALPRPTASENHSNVMTLLKILVRVSSSRSVAGDLRFIYAARFHDDFLQIFCRGEDYHMLSIRYITVSAIGVALFLAQGFMNPTQAVPTLVNDATVQDGADGTLGHK